MPLTCFSMKVSRGLSDEHKDGPRRKKNTRNKKEDASFRPLVPCVLWLDALFFSAFGQILSSDREKDPTRYRRWFRQEEAGRVMPRRKVSSSTSSERAFVTRLRVAVRASPMTRRGARWCGLRTFSRTVRTDSRSMISTSPAKRLEILSFRTQQFSVISIGLIFIIPSWQALHRGLALIVNASYVPMGVIVCVWGG